MGKTPKPLTILVHPDLYSQPWVAELEAKGHIICNRTSDAWAYDLILAPQACRFVPGMEFLLDEVVKGARRLKYPKEPR